MCPDAPSHDAFTIKRLTRKDVTLLAQVAALEKKLFKKAVSWKDSFESEVAKKNVGLYVVVPQGVPQAVAGYIMCRSTSLLTLIAKVAVAEPWRRQGLAKKLLQAAAADAMRGRSSIALALHVDVRNAPAMGLYQSLGFREDSTMRDYYGPGQDALHMGVEVDSGAVASWC